jgi:aryl-alcohol dehydrogenase-like predicted oxidoreductase
MKQRYLGNQGLVVPAIGLGCMGMSEFYGNSDNKQSLALLDKSLEIGCNFWDTADMYGPYTNEALLGEALVGRRERVILATKFGIQRGDNAAFTGICGRPDYVRESCEGSLQRLGTEYIDLYYQHRADPDVPIEETVGAMAQLVEEGKVRYLGLSEATPAQLRAAQQVHPISALQTEYSLWSRDVEAGILATTRELDIGFVAYSPLGRGFLSGAIQSLDDLQPGDWRLDNPRFTAQAIAHNQQLVELVAAIAGNLEVTPAQLALAWLLARGDDIALIPGTRQEKYLLQNWQAQEIELPAQLSDALDELSAAFTVEGTRY